MSASQLLRPEPLRLMRSLNLVGLDFLDPIVLAAVLEIRPPLVIVKIRRAVGKAGSVMVTLPLSMVSELIAVSAASGDWAPASSTLLAPV